MSAAAIIMMIITMLIIWGGLIASIIALRVLPVPEESTETGGEAEPGSTGG